MNISKAQLKRIEAKLQEKADQLSQDAVSKEDIAIERNAEILDEIQRTSDREMAMTMLNRNWETTSQVREALQRIANGTFGVCEACEEEIGERRLNAIPWAKLCIQCQTAADQQSPATWKQAA